MKKIAILVDLELSKNAGGHVKFWEKICHSVRDRDQKFDITIFFLGKQYSKKVIGKHITFYTLKPLISSRLLKPLGIDADATDLFPFSIKLLLMLRKYDLLHTTDQLFSMATTAKYASKIWKIPLTTSFHTDTPSYTEYYVKRLFEKLPKFLRKFFLHKLKLHKKISEKQRIKMINYLNICSKGMINDHLNSKTYKFSSTLRKKIYKFERGVDKSIFNKKKVDKVKFFKKYGISENEKIIFFCGRVHELKGVFLVSEIQKILQEEFRLVSFFAGQDIHGDKCIDIGGNKIKIIGYKDQNEISKFYNICDLFVFPSKYETGPQVVLEAKSCGAIPIVSPSGGGRRVYKNGIDGIIVDEYDAHKWAIEIRELFGNKKRSEFMKKKILDEFKPLSWKEVFDKYFIKEWREILK